MVLSHSISWTDSQAARRLHGYRVFLGFCLVVDVLAGLIALAASESVARQLMPGEPFSAFWIRTCGILLIGTSLMTFPGGRNRTCYRWPNWSGIVLRLLLMLVFTFEGGVFLYLALWELISAALLFVMSYRLSLADLGRHP